MNPRSPLVSGPPTWRVGLALGLVYVCWSTTYLAIQEGVRTLPPLLFGGTRIALAGAILLSVLAMRGQLRKASGASLTSMWLAGSLMFLGGNGLINIGQMTVPSGMASVLVATCPLFLALLERAIPSGERMPLLSWIGMLAGLVGVGFLAIGRGVDALGTPLGVACCLGSAFTWAVGSIVARHWPSNCPLIQSAGTQMFLGGLTMLVVGWFIGEGNALTLESFTPRAVVAFFWLLIVGSLLGFVAYIWLLGNVSAGLAGSYAYVNPALAILLGWAIGGERITLPILAGLVVILSGVALVKSAKQNAADTAIKTVPAPSDPSLQPGETLGTVTAKT